MISNLSVPGHFLEILQSGKFSGFPGQPPKASHDNEATEQKK
jgi:hypothetical protein